MRAFREAESAGVDRGRATVERILAMVDAGGRSAGRGIQRREAPARPSRRRWGPADARVRRGRERERRDGRRRAVAVDRRRVRRLGVAHIVESLGLRSCAPHRARAGRTARSRPRAPRRRRRRGRAPRRTPRAVDDGIDGGHREHGRGPDDALSGREHGLRSADGERGDGRGAVHRGRGGAHGLDVAEQVDAVVAQPVAALRQRRPARRRIARPAPPRPRSTAQHRRRPRPRRHERLRHGRAGQAL